MSKNLTPGSKNLTPQPPSLRRKGGQEGAVKGSLYPSLTGRGRRLAAGGRLRTSLGFCLLLSSSAYAAPRVTPADAPTVKRAVAAQRGHVVLVNFWATWCGPCVAEFPAIVKISWQDRARGLRTIAVSADMLKDRHTKVEPFLAKQGAAFPAYVEKSGDPGDFINAFDPAWQGDLPRTLIYDRRGRLVRTLAGEQTAQSLAAAVAPYLKER